MNRNRPRAPLLPVTLMVVAMAVPVFAASRTVHLPAGSVDGLAAAIEKAGPGGTVLVRRGLHLESGSVEIGFPVHIIGMRGAIIEFHTNPSPASSDAFVVEPALHIRGADFVTIRRLQLRPAGLTGNTAILIEDAAGVRIDRNAIVDFQMGIVIEQGDGAEISRNVIFADPAWSAKAIPRAHGIVNLNGQFVRILHNQVSGATFGILASGKRGHASGNVIRDSHVGLLLCRAPMFFQISGEFIGSEHVADSWEVQRNLTINSSRAGYMVADGGCFNKLHDNIARASTGYGLELLGDSCFLGTLMPMSFENEVIAGSRETLLVRDCGYSNHLDGAGLERAPEACGIPLCNRAPRPPEDPTRPRMRTPE